MIITSSLPHDHIVSLLFVRITVVDAGCREEEQNLILLPEVAREAVSENLI